MVQHYRYSDEEERQMDEFGKEWRRANHRGIKGPHAWRIFKLNNPWTARLTCDALRLKYMRIKKAQYWAAYARRHAECPRFHAGGICHAGGIPAFHDYLSVDDDEMTRLQNVPTVTHAIDANENQAAATAQTIAELRTNGE